MPFIVLMLAELTVLRDAAAAESTSARYHGKEPLVGHVASTQTTPAE